METKSIELRNEFQGIEKLEGKSSYDGWVYIMINAFYEQDVIKLVLLEETPEIRARQLSEGTEIPSEFKVAYKRQVYDCETVEGLVHEALHKYRMTGRRNDRSREFFKLPVHNAIDAMSKIVDKENSGN